MSVISGNALASSGSYQITNSVRLRASASAYLSRTFGSPTSQHVYTLSMFVKRSNVGSFGSLFSRADEASMLEFMSAANGDGLREYENGTSDGVTTAVQRDPSAWYHIVLSRTSSTAATLSVGNTAVKTITTTNRLNASGISHLIGARNGPSEYLDGYLSDVYFIDGQALTPSSFGETNSDGVWVPKAYSGNYGNNGFHLDFKDAALTAGSNVGLGKDVSGNGNYWTTNNISVTAGVTYDSMVDTPSVNYATLNPLKSEYVPRDGNLGLTYVSGGNNTHGTIAVSSGKWYWEVKSVGAVVGIQLASASLTENTGLGYYYDGNKYSGTSGSAYGAAWNSSNIIGVALDLDAGTLTFYKDNVSQGTAFSSISGTYTAYNRQGPAGATDYNFGQRPFAYTPPTGFKALCTANRPAGSSITVSGTFTGNANADGPFVWIGGTPTVLTINGNAVTFGTHADKTAGGFKLRTASASYNASGSNTWTATAAINFGTATLAPSPAQGNP